MMNMMLCKLTTYELWSLIISAFGSVATFAAVFVALWQTKIAYKKKLKLSLNEGCVALDPNRVFEDEEYMCLTVSNIGNRNIVLKNSCFMIGKKCLTLLCLPHNLNIIQQTLYGKNNQEKKLLISECIEINFPVKKVREAIKEELDSNPKLSKKRFKIVVFDASGTKYCIKSKSTISQFVAKE